jgi:DNA polymerase-1
MPANTTVLLLIDGYGLIYRSFYAIRELATDDGRPVNAIYGFLKTLRKLLAEEKPTHAAVVMDEGEPVARLQQLPTYKATRKPMPEPMRPQIEPIKRLIPLCGVQLLGIEGVEADDIIGTLTQQALQKNFRVIIHTNDKDMMQLVNDRVVVINPAYPEKKFDARAVLEHYGVRPDQIVDYLSLLGDSVDNIPGVAGIGEKTAVQLLSQFGSLDEIEKHLDKIERPKIAAALRQSATTLAFNRDFLSLHTVALPWKLEDLALRSPDYKALDRFCAEHQFRKLREDIAKESARRAPSQLGLDV